MVKTSLKGTALLLTRSQLEDGKPVTTIIGFWEWLIAIKDYPISYSI